MTQHNLSGAVFRKSSYSVPNGDACVEVAQNIPGIVAVRDSKNILQPALVFSTASWRSFTSEIKAD